MERKEAGNSNKHRRKAHNSQRKILQFFSYPTFSPLRPVMVQGKWEGVASRLGSDGFAGPP
jgi:hypothetical protein